MYSRVTKETLYFLHVLIKGDIKIRNKQFREAVNTEEKFTTQKI